ncbi:MAG: glycosyltransferase family 39 protein [Nitrospinae bacterium]|nr:glycosyltransferase family 39 protein [Nitrospinota bacterium]
MIEPFHSTRDSRQKIQLALAALFTLFAGKLVLHYEYREGGFIHYFFKAGVWYAGFNKIIFPFYFWAGCLSFAILSALARGGEFEKDAVSGFLKRAFFYHLFLLLLTHSGEITPGLTLLPTRAPTVQGITQYENLLMQVFFISYYAYCLHIACKIIASRIKFHELIFPVSMAVPFIYLPSPAIHLGYAAVGLGIFSLWRIYRNEFSHWTPNRILGSSIAKISFIFLVGLFFRLWYAYYVSSFGPDAPKFDADGPAYYESALAFASGNIDDVNFWHAPFYSLYLSVFLDFLGHTPKAILYSQALLGATVSVIIYKIAQRLGGPKIAFISGLAVATSHLCINYSVVINRSTPILITLPLIVYLCLDLNERGRAFKSLFIGVLMGMTFYFGQETIFTLAVLTAYLVFARMRKGVDWNGRLKCVSGLILGILLAIGPLNWIAFNHSGKWIPMGRDSAIYDSTSTWNYNGNPYAREMTALGFNPIKNPSGSLETLFDHPLKITGLILDKLISEIPGFLLDPGGTFLPPLHLSFESFYAAHVQFYIYFFLAIGLFSFLRDKRIPPLYRGLILAPVFLQALFTSLIVFGTFRFRAQITPINMIFVAYGLDLLFSSSPKQTPVTERALPFPAPNSFSVRIPDFMKGRPIAILAACLTAILPAAAMNWPAAPTPESDSGYNATDWLTVENQSVHPTNLVNLYLPVFAYYEKKEASAGPDPAISVSACGYLFPGVRPYIRFAADGKFLGPPKEAPRGCREIKEKFRADFKKGMVSVFLFFSRKDGQTDNPVPIQFEAVDSRSQKSPLVLPMVLSLDTSLKKTVDMFDDFAYGQIKISRLRLIKD